MSRFLCPLLAQAPDEACLRSWLRLAYQPGLTAAPLRQLLQLMGSPAAIFGGSVAQLAPVVGHTAALALLRPPDPVHALAVTTALQWCQHSGHRILVYAEPEYPDSLRDLHDPPLVLFVRGQVAQLSRPGVALVGARQASPGGCELARAFGYALANAGWSVVSGLARGIDAAAHEGALRAQGGAGTLAVMATGIDRVYPRQNLALAQHIVQAGAVVSELPLATPSAAFQFPRRNRLVAALARGIVVIEAAPRSGSLITARLAGELGREVFAVPGSVHSSLARGCHALIREGAYLTESAADVIEVLTGTPRLPLAQAWRQVPEGERAAAALPGASASTLAGHAEPPYVPAESWVSAAVTAAVLQALGHDPVTLDALLQRTSLPSPVVQTGLLALELDGRACRLPDGRWQQLISAGL